MALSLNNPFLLRGVPHIRREKKIAPWVYRSELLIMFQGQVTLDGRIFLNILGFNLSLHEYVKVI